MKIILFISFCLLIGCKISNSFNFTSDYRTYPIAVDCEKPEDVSLTFQKEGMETIHVDQKYIDFRKITDDKGNVRPVCIFNNLNLLQFCQYKGPDEVGPYWVANYSKINAVKCKEVLK